MPKKLQKDSSKSATDSISSVLTKRPPVVAVMGHIDHGKSTLLDYIRKSNVVAGETGGITQRISAYEVIRDSADGKSERITFIDTPGHEAFAGMRERGATTADIAILVVSAEDGVKKQTIEAYQQIKTAGVPMIVAINKIDKPNADVERVKLSLAENEIYLEGYGGSISYVPISAKTGQGINDLLDIIILTADVAELTANPSVPASGAIIEAYRDPKKGISATLVIKNGSMKTGMFVASGSAYSPTRLLEDSNGKKVTEATVCAPIRVVGWNEAPKIGSQFICLETKKELETYLEEMRLKKMNSTKIKPEQTEVNSIATTEKEITEKKVIPLIIKADVLGSAEAIEHEIRKIKNDRVTVKIVYSSIGDITESDIKIAGSNAETVVAGFNVKTDAQAKAMIERLGLTYSSFDIIYKLIEWVESLIKERTPMVESQEVAGKAKIMKFFSSIKDKQIIGGKVIDREIKLGHAVKIYRRETLIGEGVIRELQQAKVKTSSVQEGFEFGAMIDSKIELAPGDIIEDFVMVTK